MIEIRGAFQNNLKGVSFDLPLGQLCVVTGPSGSGKSSLAFDTIYAEGQRRYVETFSPYTRQFLDRMDKPKVEAIRGIPPAIAIEQSNSVKSTRSTVGTITEINDYLKLLMPRVARGICPCCGRQVKPETPREIVETLFKKKRAKNLLLTFHVPVPDKTKATDFFAFLQSQGYLRVWLERKIIRTDGALDGDIQNRTLEAQTPIQVIQDRVTLDDTKANRGRIMESIESALRYGKGMISFIDPVTGDEERFSTGWHCPHCNIELKSPTPGLFSFNHPVGACPQCRGFGRVISIDLDRAIPNKRLSIAQGVVKPFQGGQSKECQVDLLRACKREEIDVRCPFEELPKSDQDFVLYGETSAADPEEVWRNGGWYGVKGYFDWMETKSYKMHVRVLLSRYRNYTLCPSCHGGRYQPETLNYRIFRARDQALLTLPDIAQLSIHELLELMVEVELPAKDSTEEMLKNEIVNRLQYLLAVGLGYLNLDRPTRTLSGGEIERVNLTTCLGASLVNTLFVLDEPSVGLHPRDIGRMIRVMRNLRDKGNTLLVVEHEEAVIRAADFLIDVGPGRGEVGGELVFCGPAQELFAKRRGAAASLTRDYLTGKKGIPLPAQRRKPSSWIQVRGATEHNLKDIDVDFPLGVFACVTGVSGSGKSTLVHDVLYQNLLRQKSVVSEETAGACQSVKNADAVGSIIMVDQSPLSKTPRSNPALYLGVYDAIRHLFAASEEAIAAGLSASAFSFNSSTGRCERCSGNGFEKIEMQFLSDLYVRCSECEGKRFQPHVLKVKVNGKNIHDVLEMTVAEAIAFFSKDLTPKWVSPLTTLAEVGLDYLRIGQPLNTLSGGEAQRLKLVSHLIERQKKPKGESALLIFDEPTTGLHFDDIALLIKVFQHLVEQGESVLVIEHNLEVIKCADYLIDLGPEAGAEGGMVVARGTPEEVASVHVSHTGRFLKGILDEGGRIHEEPQEEYASRSRALVKTNSTPQVSVIGAREHNLKNISLTIPREQMVIITGLSGSGKSTLAFDLLFAEGQRRFLDSMSPYARQFVEQLERPDVDAIEGLPPSVAIEQRITRGSGKSTVATVTEVYHFLRLLFAKLGTQFCPKCQIPVEKQSQAMIVKQIEVAAEAAGAHGKIRVMAPLIKARKGFHTDVAKWVVQHGLQWMLVDGQWIDANEFKKLERFKEHTIDVMVGEVSADEIRRGKVDLRAIVQQAIQIGKGSAKLIDSKKRQTVLSTEMSCPSCGLAFEELDPRLFSFNSPHGWCKTCRGYGQIWDSEDVAAKLKDNASEIEKELAQERAADWLVEDEEALLCSGCAGARLNEVARNVRLTQHASHQTPWTIDWFVNLPVTEALEQLKTLSFQGNQKTIASDILVEIDQRLKFMSEVGLDYLTLGRAANTLSGGETQRIRLAAQLGSNLRGVLYVLDEPTIGLHPRDNVRLLDTLEALKAKGNSLVIVEHDDETMRRADYIIDLGPGPGVRGGEVVAAGSLKEIESNPNSVTGQCLLHPIQHPIAGSWRELDSVPWLELNSACYHNLKNVDAKFPIGRFSVITGISGSGKSTLMRSVLLPAVLDSFKQTKRRHSKSADEFHFKWKSIKGVEHLEAVYEVDQSPIGKTSRSTPATYVGIFDEIRALFAQLPLARMRGYTASRFSFNVGEGRCEICEGHGVIKHEMSFLPTSYTVCDACGGKRYNPATLEVLYQDKSIGDVLELSIEQAAELFRTHPKIYRTLSLLVDTGLGYLRLGQPSPTLSGGEAQRLKLATELTRGIGGAQNAKLRQRRKPKSTLYLLEEPTVGLHMADVKQLVKVLHRLVDEGHTVIVIEHHLTLIAEADYILDMGPEAGEKGGQLVTSGPPKEVAKNKVSRIAPFLCEVLKA